MERVYEEEIVEPVSPTGQYLTSSALSVYILAVLETEVPIDNLQTVLLLQNLFLPINPRFSSIMVDQISNLGLNNKSLSGKVTILMGRHVSSVLLYYVKEQKETEGEWVKAAFSLGNMYPIKKNFLIKDKNGEKKWKRVEVKLEDHIKVPTFPIGKSSNFLYDEYLDEYMSTIAMEHLPQHRPLWELHMIKYPSSGGAGTLVFKLHHALGDGFSLMGALLSCMQRADKISLPFTLPSSQGTKSISTSNAVFKRLPYIFSLAYRTISEFGWSLLKSSLIEDDQTPIRSCAEDTKVRKITISNVTFSLDQIKEVKSKLGVSINDVLAGLIFFGIRLYMQEINLKSSKTESTALVLLNTRNIEGYRSIKEMVEKTNSSAAWGNQYAFLHIPIPELTDSKYANPLEFIWEVHKEMNKKKNSLATPLTGMLLDSLRKLRGPEAAARYLHSTLRNSSTTISNMIGPVEQMAVANLPIKGFYFMVAGSPESLTITIMSYMGKIRIAFGLEKDFIDKQLFKSCMENSLEMIMEAARKISA